MAILDWEGFDRETANLGIFSQLNGFNFSPDGQGYGNHGRYAKTTYGTIGRYGAFPNNNTLFLQLHFRYNNFPNNLKIGLVDGSTFQVYIHILSDNIPRLYRGDNTLLATATETLLPNVWYFLQLKAVISSSGSLELRVQGKTVATYTGNTKNTANAVANGWKVDRPYGATSNESHIDNLLIYDSTGDPPNTWTPETRIYDSLPNGAGSTTQWTPSAGANWQCVDEQPSNGDTDYVSAAAAGLTDTYAVPAVAAPGSIVYAVGVHATARKDDAGTNEIDGVLHSGLLDYAHGTPKPLSTSYARQRWLWSTDPATGLPWTVAGANAAQPGIRRTT